MNKICLFLLVACAFSTGRCAQPATTAAPVGDARTRAQLYQAATLKILLVRKWNVTTNQAGKLVANSLVPPRGERNRTLIEVPMLARLTIVFTPQSTTYTKCVASIVGYMDGRHIPVAILQQATGDPNVKQGVIGPVPLNDSEYTAEIQDIMGRAEKELTKQHAEFAAR